MARSLYTSTGQDVPSNPAMGLLAALLASIPDALWVIDTKAGDYRYVHAGAESLVKGLRQRRSPRGTSTRAQKASWGCQRSVSTPIQGCCARFCSTTATGRDCCSAGRPRISVTRSGSESATRTARFGGTKPSDSGWYPPTPDRWCKQGGINHAVFKVCPDTGKAATKVTSPRKQAGG